MRKPTPKEIVTLAACDAQLSPCAYPACGCEALPERIKKAFSDLTAAGFAIVPKATTKDYTVDLSLTKEEGAIVRDALESLHARLIDSAATKGDGAFRKIAAEWRAVETILAKIDAEEKLIEGCEAVDAITDGGY